MSYKELQAALKDLKAQGLTDIKLNATKAELQAEYDRLTNEPSIEPEVNPEVNSTTDNETSIDTSEIVVTETLTITPGSFRDIIRKPLHRYRHPKAQGFKFYKLTHAEWLGDTLAFLDDMCMDEYDYIAA